MGWTCAGHTKDRGGPVRGHAWPWGGREGMPSRRVVPGGTVGTDDRVVSNGAHVGKGAQKLSKIGGRYRVSSSGKGVNVSTRGLQK